MSGSCTEVDKAGIMSICDEIEIDIRSKYRKDIIERYKKWHEPLVNGRIYKILSKIFKWSRESVLTPEIEKHILENPKHGLPKFLLDFSNATGLNRYYQSQIKVNEIANKIRFVCNHIKAEKITVSIDDLFLLFEYYDKISEKKVKNITAPEVGTPFVQTMTAITNQEHEK